jgi:hypothetical protein
MNDNGSSSWPVEFEIEEDSQIGDTNASYTLGSK